MTYSLPAAAIPVVLAHLDEILGLNTAREVDMALRKYRNQLRSELAQLTGLEPSDAPEDITAHELAESVMNRWLTDAD